MLPLRSSIDRLLLSSIAALWLTACGGATPVTGDEEADLAADKLVHGTLAPQSFVHDTVSDGHPSVAWEVQAAAGEVLAPDVWPAPSTNKVNKLVPVLTLLGPAKAGKRPLLASGTARNEDDRHQAIDGFYAPKAGSYLVVVTQEAPGRGGELTLRLWTSGSHAPRAEKAQLDLALRSSAAMQAILAGHAQAGQTSAWTDDQLHAATALFLSQPARLVALSDAEQLLLALEFAVHEGRATSAQLEKTRATAASLVGAPASFATWTPQEQSFALYWLGDLTRAVFGTEDVDPAANSAALQNLRSQLDALLASWKGATAYGDRHVRAVKLAGAAFGYAADWSAALNDRDGSPVFTWYSTDYFDKNGRWLGEQSAGASEPEDD